MFRHSWGCRTAIIVYIKKWNILESLTKGGDSPVHVQYINLSSILSTAEHEKFCGKLPGPSGKAKYSWETDSELVPWGKGEKHPEQGSEIVPETVRLQAVGVCIYVDDGVPFA